MPHPVDVTVGNRVREMRIRKGFSQQVLGESVGVSFQQVQKYERGKPHGFVAPYPDRRCA